MRKIITGISVIILAGCTTPIIDDMANNDFVGVTAEPAPNDLVGTWTGSMGPYLATLRIGKDGNGLLCSSYAGTDSVMRVKYADNSIKAQTGTPMDVKSMTEDRLNVQAPYFGSPEHTFYKDKALKNASPFCAKEFG